MHVLTRLAVACSLLLAPWLARPVQAQPHAMLVAINACGQGLSLLVSTVSESGRRETHGWFNIAPNSQQTLLIDGNPLTHSAALPFYIYATNADETVIWSDEDLRVWWQGRSYSMQQRNLMVVDGTGPFAVRAVQFDC